MDIIPCTAYFLSPLIPAPCTGGCETDADIAAQPVAFFQKTVYDKRHINFLSDSGRVRTGSERERGAYIMRKDILMPALAVVGGGAGFVLRRWQLASAFRPEAGLFTRGAPATAALLGVCGLSLVLLLVLLQGENRKTEDFLAAFGCPQSGQMAALAAAGLLLLAAGALGVREGMSQLSFFRSGLSSFSAAYPAALLLCALLCLPAGAGLLLLGQAAYRREVSDTTCRLASFPAFAALVWLFATHLAHGSEPVLMRYGFTLAASGLLMLAHYYAAGFLFGRVRPRMGAFCALSGVVLGLTSLADGPGLFTAAMTAAFSLSALALARVLLRSMFGPPWPRRLVEGRMPPAEEGNTDDA